MDITGWRSAEAGDRRSPHRGGEPEIGRVGGGVTAVDGVSECDDAEGGEPSERALRDRQVVRSRSVAAKGHDVQRAPRRSRRIMMVITDTLTGAEAEAIVAGAEHGTAVMAGSEVNMEEITGNDDAKLAPTTRT